MNCLEKNNIPAGYKDSAVGIIPQEWEVKPFKNLGTFLRTNTLSREHMNNVEGLALNIHYGDVLVRYGEILDCSKTAIPWVNNSCRETRLGDRLQNGDIVISDTAEDYTVGKATEVCNVGNNCVMSGLHTMAFRPPKETFALRYLGYYFNSPAYRAQLYSLIQGIKVCSISKSAISNTYIPVPPMEEQRKIAEILGVWDEVIEKQSRLIEKLELRKRGLMQRLLTGFTTPWQKCLYSDILKEVKRTMTWDDNEEYDLISVKRRSGGLFHRDRLLGKDIKTKNLRPAKCGDFLISKMQIVHGASGLVTEEFDEMKISGSYIALVAIYGDMVDMKFINWYSKTPYFYHQTYVSSYGVHIEKMTFDLESFMSMNIMLPPFPEQKAIAEVLTTADDEIVTHRKKLDALRLQKRGLMQQLLTGKTRVKI